MATNQDYKNINYDRLAIWVKKGSRDSYKKSAAEFGISLAMLVQNGIEEFIKNHAGEKFPLEVKPETISATDRRLLDEFNQLPADAQKSLMKFLRAINESKGGGDNGDD